MVSKPVKYTFEGDGIRRALQESVTQQKDLMVVCDYDNNGTPINLGYCLIPRGKAIQPNTPIIRFKPGEIQLKLEHATSDSPKATLGATFSHPKSNERHFMLRLPIDTEYHLLLRILFRMGSKSINGFVIQAEIIDTFQVSRPLVRYDQAHGFIHRDMIFKDGRKEKHKTVTQNVNTAVVFAIDEIRDNLISWFTKLGYATDRKVIPNQTVVIEELDKAKNQLLELIKDPNKISSIESSYFHIIE